MRLTYSVIAIIVLPMLAAAIFPDRAAAIDHMAATVIPAMLGIYGTILGFYFGDRK